jgi:hypothetical protein
MSLRTRLRPLTIGASISHLAGPTGTLGAFVMTPDGIGILSAGNVLAPTSQAKEGDSIHHPGLGDIEALTPRTRIATLYNWTRLSQDSPNIVDAGVALLTDEIEYLGNRIPSGLGCPVEGHILNEIADPSDFPDLFVKRVGKIGRTTAYTEGIITSFAISSLTINYPTGNSTFHDVFEIETVRMPFSQPGDGGAIIFTLDPVKVIGLILAGSIGTRPRTYAIPIKSVLESLKVDLISF